MKIQINVPNFLSQLPKLPGVYRFYDEYNTLLYIGKAINLKNRVSSYFQKQQNTSPRISIMVQKINWIEITITENETSALILENNLIKELKPKYNIIFRDDKTYPLIRITNHKFPKIDYYRGKTTKSSKYFGPYPNATATKQAIDTIQKIFKLRTCSDNFFASRIRPCILYQIKRCTAPCVGFVDGKQYSEQIKLSIDFLNGKYNQLLHNLTNKMNHYAQEHEFELAASIRDEIIIIKQIQASQIITNHDKPLNADLITYEVVANELYIYLIIVRNGMYIGDNHFVIAILENDYQYSLEVFLENHYISTKNTQTIIIDTTLDNDFMKFFANALSINIDTRITNSTSKLFAMAKVNLKKIIENSYKHFADAINTLSELLLISTVKRIECIDVSHNQGDNTVASIVVFDNEIIDNSQYKKYNLPPDVHGNDLLAMELVWERRLSSNIELPDVILVDGGQLQLDRLKNILSRHELYGKIKVVGIFKGERRNPIFDQLILDDGRIVAYREAINLFRLLQELRDEAHRFAITGHRKKQIKKMTNSVLAEIPNIGTIKKRALLLRFGSVKAIADASIDDLREAVGIGQFLANKIYEYFH